ncbi:MAG: hypothetical protein H5U02_01510 [Clostridia bacterium]|nr:hypothetical protein [Clostridia bacterium]
MAKIIQASVTISSDGEVVTVFAEPTPPYWTADPCADCLVAVLRETDGECGRETGKIAGIEIIGLKDFTQWDEIPDLPGLWQIGGAEPLPIKELLKKIQSSLRPRP